MYLTKEEKEVAVTSIRKNLISIIRNSPDLSFGNVMTIFEFYEKLSNDPDPFKFKTAFEGNAHPIRLKINHHENLNHPAEHEQTAEYKMNYLQRQILADAIKMEFVGDLEYLNEGVICNEDIVCKIKREILLWDKIKRNKARI